MVREVGLTTSVKSEGPVTTKVTVVAWARVPLVAVIVMGYDPAGVELRVVIVRVEDPEPLIVLGLKLALAPDGKPLALKLTLPLNPFKAVTVAE